MEKSTERSKKEENILDDALRISENIFEVINGEEYNATLNALAFCIAIGGFEHGVKRKEFLSVAINNLEAAFDSLEAGKAAELAARH